MTKKILRQKILRLRKLKYDKNFSIKISKIYKILKKHKYNNPSIGGYIEVNYEIKCIEVLKELEKKNLKYHYQRLKKIVKWSFLDGHLSIHLY